VPELEANGVRLHFEEQGEGAPILCIHGTGSAGFLWADPIAELARLGRVISYDRRGHSRSERPVPYERVSVAEYAADAAALLDALATGPAVAIGRSYGGAVAVELAVQRPDLMRALVLLEAVELEYVPVAAEWARALGAELAAVAERDGVDAVGEAMIERALGEGIWPELPEPMRRTLTENGPAILAEQLGEYVSADAAALAAITQPVLAIVAADSVPELREVPEALARVMPAARTATVEGGHLIDPAHPLVLDFVAGVIGDAVPPAGADASLLGSVRARIDEEELVTPLDEPWEAEDQGR
jgi:esterase